MTENSKISPRFQHPKKYTPAAKPYNFHPINIFEEQQEEVINEDNGCIDTFVIEKEKKENERIKKVLPKSVWPFPTPQQDITFPYKTIDKNS